MCEISSAHPVVRGAKLTPQWHGLRIGRGDSLGQPGRFLELGASLGIAAESEVDITELDQSLDRLVVDLTTGSVGFAGWHAAQAGSGDFQ